MLKHYGETFATGVKRIRVLSFPDHLQLGKDVFMELQLLLYGTMNNVFKLKLFRIELPSHIFYKKHGSQKKLKEGSPTRQ